MEEERIGLFIDYENLAIGAREDLGIEFDFKPVADALAERGRVVVRRAYADWTYFEKDRRMLTDNQIELIEIPQRKGAVRKNAADIKMAVDAVELAFERDYVTMFVLCTGDSDFTPLVHKLRERNRRVIGVGLKDSTSKLLPAACDEFLFYENLSGVDIPDRKPKKEHKKTEQAAPKTTESPDVLIVPTLAGLIRAGNGDVRASSLKRALLRKDPTFTETDYGFRAFGELMRHLADQGVVELDYDDSQGDPAVRFSKSGRGEEASFGILHDAVAALGKGGVPVALSGLKNEMRKRDGAFSEKKLGYSGFLQFVKAAAAGGYVDLLWDDDTDDYVVSAP
ncbi:MAG: NYN domain-containing protein [Acidimicrobiia bacterium]